MSKAQEETIMFAAAGSSGAVGRGATFLGKVGLAVVLVGTLLAVGCASVGRKFDSSRVSEIHINRTTQSEVRQMFGSPWRTGIEDGLNTWTYGRYKYRLFGEASTTDLVIRFDRDGIVRSYTFNTTEHTE